MRISPNSLAAFEGSFVHHAWSLHKGEVLPLSDMGIQQSSQKQHCTQPVLQLVKRGLSRYMTEPLCLHACSNAIKLATSMTHNKLCRFWVTVGVACNMTSNLEFLLVYAL